MLKVGKYEGKIPMARSNKPEAKKVEKKKELSKEEQARLRYLGNLAELHEVPQ